jgi:hypothetical protein
MKFNSHPFHGEITITVKCLAHILDIHIYILVEDFLIRISVSSRKYFKTECVLRTHSSIPVHIPTVHVALWQLTVW